MSNIWDFIFENDKTVQENIVEWINQVGENPIKFTKMFWFFFIQFCIALILLILSVLFPIWLIYG